MYRICTIKITKCRSQRRPKWETYHVHGLKVSTSERCQFSPNWSIVSVQFYQNPRKDFYTHRKFIPKSIWEGMGPQIPGTILRKAKWEKCPTQCQGLLEGCGAGGRGVSEGPATEDVRENPTTPKHPTSSRLILDKCAKSRNAGRTVFSINGAETISYP